MSTLETIDGKEFSTVGIVRGNAVRAKWIGKDIFAALRNMAGGEIIEYKELFDETREIVIERMMDDANRLGADAVLGVRFETTTITQGASELLAYGTAVKFK